MTHRAFLIAGNNAKLVANDVCDFRYRAASHYLPAGAQAPTACHPCAETQFMVEGGTIECMVGGAIGIVRAGDFVRVPAGVPYAYRNTGTEAARVLVRTASPNGAARAAHITAEFAA
jgi:mannose-6-phosphate isomerase-like protein (cupin superfamily)